MKNCPNCGAQNADDSRFCTECGKPIPQGSVCPHCGASVNDGDVFCRKCGKNLNAPQNVEPIQYEEEEEKRGIMKKIFPYIIGTLLLVVIIGYYFSKNSNGDVESSVTVGSATEEVDTIMQDKTQMSNDSFLHDFNNASVTYHNLVGTFTDMTGVYPVEVSFSNSGNEVSNVLYKNVRVGTKISMQCTEFSNKRLRFEGKDGKNSFIISLVNSNKNDFKGTAVVGDKEFEVEMKADCTHEKLEYDNTNDVHDGKSETNNYDWLQGHWVYDTPNGRINVVIEGNHIIQYRNSRSESRNPMYTIENNEIRAMFYDGMMTTYKIDTYNKRIDIGDGNWMHKIE